MCDTRPFPHRPLTAYAVCDEHRGAVGLAYCEGWTGMGCYDLDAGHPPGTATPARHRPVGVASQPEMRVMLSLSEWGRHAANPSTSCSCSYSRGGALIL